MTQAASIVRNNVSLSSNGALVVVSSGVQTTQSLTSLTDQLQKQITVLRKQKTQHKILILIDVTRVHEYNPEAFTAMQDMLAGLDFDSMAVLGVKTESQVIWDAFATAAKKQSKIHFFDTSIEASRWLAGDVIQQASSARALAHPIWPARRQKRTI